MNVFDTQVKLNKQFCTILEASLEVVEAELAKICTNLAILKKQGSSGLTMEYDHIWTGKVAQIHEFLQTFKQLRQ